MKLEVGYLSPLLRRGLGGLLFGVVVPFMGPDKAGLDESSNSKPHLSKARINNKAIPEQDGLQLFRVGTFKRSFQILSHEEQESESSHNCQTAQQISS